MNNIPASVRARLLNVAKAQGVDFNQVLVRFALERILYDFCESRAGAHARAFLGEWRGSLVCDDYAGYKASFGQGVVEAGCLAHARRKFFELHAANKSQIAEFALNQLGRVYGVEQQIKELPQAQRLEIRQRQSRPILDSLREWMVLQGRVRIFV